MSADRARPSRLTPWLTGLAIWVMTAWAFPYFASLGSPNELTRLYLTRAIVDDGSFSIDGPVDRHGPITDMARADGRLYSDKAPGVGLFGVPVYGLMKVLAGLDPDGVSNASLLRALRIFLVGLPAGLTAVLLFGLLGRLGLERRRRFVLVWAWGLGTVAFAYGSLLFGHGLCALFLTAGLAAIARSREESPPVWIQLGVGAALGAALLTEYTSLLLVAPLAAAAVWVAPDRLRAIGFGIAGALLPLGMLALYHTVCFGAPWASGYSHLANAHYAQVHAEGLFGLVTPSFSRLANILFGSTRGLFFYSPWLLLAPVGLGLAVARPQKTGWRPIWIALASASLLYLLFSMSLKLDAWGWSLGPRHLTPLLPFWTLAIGALLLRGPKLTRATDLTLKTLVPYSAAAIVIPLAVFGGFPPDFSNPLADFVGPLLATGCLGPNVGTSLGLPPFWGALPLFLGAFGAMAWLISTGPARLWQKLTCAALALLLTVLAFTLTGPTEPGEHKALTWVEQDVLGCRPDGV